ncbi:MAG: PKD domain-containing protein [Paludibacteraceae bacterium]|nr:PKD domain-containing protein [Paludibacteraceae bacterium]
MKKSIFMMALLCLVSCSKQEEVDLTAFSKPHANFETVINGLKVSFKNTSTNGDTYTWKFGDGNTSTQKSPEHTYKSAGSYKVELTVQSTSDKEGKDVFSKTISVKGQSLAAKFSYKANGREITFINQSVSATEYSWDFGDGTSSTEKSPVHTYAKSGKYVVMLTVGNGTAKEYDTATLKLTVQAKEAAAAFTYQVRQPLTVIFNNTSTNAVSYKWDFGDGTTSTLKSPEHKYASIGNYDVTLTVVNEDGKSPATVTKRVSVTAPTKCHFTGITVNGLAYYNRYYRFKWIDGGFTSIEAFDAAQGRVISKSDMPMHIDFQKKYAIDMTESSYLIYIYSTSNPGIYSYTKDAQLRYNVSDIKKYAEQLTMTGNGYNITIHLEWQ